MKTAISIPDHLFQAAEQLATKMGVSRSELYRRAMARYLEGHSEFVIREALDKLYGEDNDLSRLDTAIEYLQNTSLPEEEW
jgi:hypothetical protein